MVPKQSQGFSLASIVLPVLVPSILFSIGEAALLPLIPANAYALGADLPTAGIIAGLVMLGTISADLPAARLVDHVGERVAMIIGTFVGMLGMVMAFFAPNLYLLGFGVLLLGGAAAVFYLARHAWMAEHVPLAFRARALSLLGGTFRAGGFIGPLLSSWVIFASGVKPVFLLAGVFIAASTAVLVVAKTDEAPAKKSASLRGILAVAKKERRALSTIGVGSAILGALRTTRNIGLPLWAIAIAMPNEQTALYIGFAGILDFALFYTSGQIMDRFGRRWAAIPTSIGLGLTHMLVFLAVDANGFLWVALAMALANGLGSGIVLTLGADLAPSHARNEFLASYRLVVDTGLAATPWVLSSLTTAIGLGAAMASFGVLGFVGAGLFAKYIPELIEHRRVSAVEAAVEAAAK